MSAPVLSRTIALRPAAATAVHPMTAGAAGSSLDDDATAVLMDPPTVPAAQSQEKLPLWVRMLVIFGSAIACWAVLIAAVAAVTR
jgi:hypothetical protein